MTSFIEIKHGGDLYRELVGLRRDMLRKPLGLDFTQRELAEEADYIHLAAMDEEDGVIGCLILVPTTKGVMKMRQVAVRPNCQRNGIGAKLVEFAEGIAAEHGVDRIVLHARATVIEFYRKLGYRPSSGVFMEVGIAHVSMDRMIPRLESVTYTEEPLNTQTVSAEGRAFNQSGRTSPVEKQAKHE